MPARDVLRHSARRHILWRWHPAPHAATPARQARSVGVHPGSLLAVKPLKTDFLSVTADAPLVTTRIGSFEEISGNRGEEKTRPASGPPSDTPAAPRLPELGDRQHQPHQIHLPGDRQFLVDLLQVPVSGAFREPRRQGHVAYALPTRRGTCPRCRRPRQSGPRWPASGYRRAWRRTTTPGCARTRAARSCPADHTGHAVARIEDDAWPHGSQTVVCDTAIRS